MPDGSTGNIRTTSFLSGQGDTTFGWDASDDNWVIPMIQQKMNEGYTFWITRRNPVREARLRTVSDLGDARQVTIKDDSARQLFEQGRIGIIAAAPGERQAETVLERRADNAREAAENDTIAHRAGRGG